MEVALHLGAVPGPRLQLAVDIVEDDGENDETEEEEHPENDACQVLV